MGEESSSIDPNEESIDFSEIDSTTSGYWGSDEYGDLVTNQYGNELSESKYLITKKEYEGSEFFDEENSTQSDDNGNDNELDNSLFLGNLNLILLLQMTIPPSAKVYFCYF